MFRIPVVKALKETLIIRMKKRTRCTTKCRARFCLETSTANKIYDYPFLCPSFLPGEKYESTTVEEGYKVYMKLRIRNVGPKDFTNYICVAKNSLGGTDGKITLYG